MALESLLSSLENGVSEVAGVQANSGAVFGCNPSKFGGVSGVSDQGSNAKAATPDTPRKGGGVSRKPAPMLDCTPDTPDTREMVIPQGEAPETKAAHPFDPEAWEERAAIAEFDGGMSRQDAERLAWDEDDRRRCAQCANLTAGGLCLAARRGEITASRNYEPSRTLPRRCEGYAPGADDPDRRPGGERWQGLRGKIGA